MADAKLGTKIDKLYAIKEDIDLTKIELGKTKEAKKILKLNKKYDELANDLMDTIPKDKLNGGIGKKAVASITTTRVGQVTDWNQVYKFIKRTNGFDLLNRAFNNAAYRERLDNKKTVPGVKTAKVHKLSLRKKPS